MRKSIGFIGGGRITRILLQGFSNRKLKFKRVVVTDVNPLVLEKLNNDYPFIQTDSASVAAGQDIVFLAMDKNVIMDTLGLLRNDFKNDPIVVSLVPDTNFAKLALRLTNVDKIARILPTPATYINEAYTAVSFSPGFAESDKDEVLELFNYLGKTIEVPEDKLQTYSVMAAILPVYFWYQWKELIAMGKEIGLTEQETVNFINESVLSSLHLNYRFGMTEDQVIGLMPVSPVEESETEIRGIFRNRLIDLYRRVRPQIMENTSSSRI